VYRRDSVELLDSGCNFGDIRRPPAEFTPAYVCVWWTGWPDCGGIQVGYVNNTNVAVLEICLEKVLSNTRA
jgi:hypothetical protein